MNRPHALALLALGALAGSACGSSSGPAASKPPFLWGTAIAGFQGDMGCPTVPAEQCEDRNSDWYQWVTDPDVRADAGTAISGDPVSRSPGQWELYDSDFALAHDALSNNALRLSIEWSRIFPRSTAGVTGHDALAAIADPAAIAHYHAVFASLRSHGLEPLVTLNHYTLPLWIHDGKACHQGGGTCDRAGWLDAGTVAEIAKYAGFCAEEFGAQVDLWATLNEPLAVVVAGYLTPSPDRTNPPGISNVADAVKVLYALADAHRAMFDAIHAGDHADANGDGEAAAVGAVPNLVACKGTTDSAADAAAADHACWFWNRAFLEAAVLGAYDRNLDGQFEDVTADAPRTMDFIGINYYTRITVGAIGVALDPAYPWLDFLPSNEWEDYPAGMTETVRFASRYGLPIYITENGKDAPDGSGDAASRYLVQHVAALEAARAGGIDVRGYFYWSFVDNYEWNHGMSVHMGLFGFDAADAMKRRVAKPAVAVYQAIAKAGGTSAAQRAQFDAAAP